MRGKPCKNCTNVCPRRNIPAYAGKTPRFCGLFHRGLEHPRVCGENAHGGDSQSGRFGNIPAYAGKTYLRVRRIRHRKEHPRVCGENLAFYRPELELDGTSPRMRGKRIASVSIEVLNRNIPAYAGKTLHSCNAAQGASEHPRVCGENASVPLALPGVAGTSPRMRGKP